MKIVSVGTSLPDNYYSQDDILRYFTNTCWKQSGIDFRKLKRIAGNVQVEGRYSSLKLEELVTLSDFGTSNKIWLENATKLGAKALMNSIELSPLCADDIRTIVSTTVTGIATPSLEARLMNLLDLPENLKRVPLFGLGCVAGVAGIARVSDYLKAYPSEAGMLLSVEQCFLTFQRDDISIENMVGSSLFGDGAAAVTMVGSDHTAFKNAKGPEILASQSTFYPDTETAMGWDVRSTGFKLLLSSEVPNLVEEHLRSDVEDFLSGHGLTLKDINSYVCHPGGPKVLKAIEKSLDLSSDALHVTWDNLRRNGNLSSSSVLFVLKDTMEMYRPKAGTYGLMIAMGPAFCSELILIRW